MPNYPNRCQHIKVNGTQCGSPALRRHRLCFFHKRFQDERIRVAADRARRGAGMFILPVLEDANSIQIALMQVMRLLLAHQIEPETARLLLTALRTASANLRHTSFRPSAHDVVLERNAGASELDPRTDTVWRDEDFEDEEEDEEQDNGENLEDEEVEEEDEDDEDEPAAQPAMRKEPRSSPQSSERPRPMPSATVNASGSAAVATTPPEKIPPSGTNAERVREQIRNQVRESLFPDGFPGPDPRRKTSP